MNLTNKKRLTDDIVIFENFLTPEQCQAVIDVIEKQVSVNKLSWTPITFYESYSSVLPQDNDEELSEFNLSPTFFSDVQKAIVEAVAQVHDKDPKNINKIGYHTQKWEPGAYAKEHSDNTDMEGNFGPFERSRYAAFLYLNEDFEGGLLNFLKQDVSLAPKTGLLATFSGSFENTHEVTLITKGIRYTLGSFWDDRDESAYPQELRDAWEKEMKEIRDKQEEIKGEWQDKLKNGYKIDVNGNEYKIEEMQ